MLENKVFFRSLKYTQYFIFRINERFVGPLRSSESRLQQNKYTRFISNVWQSQELNNSMIPILDICLIIPWQPTNNMRTYETNLIMPRMLNPFRLRENTHEHSLLKLKFCFWHRPSKVTNTKSAVAFACAPATTGRVGGRGDLTICCGHSSLLNRQLDDWPKPKLFATLA